MSPTRRLDAGSGSRAWHVAHERRSTGRLPFAGILHITPVPSTLISGGEPLAAPSRPTSYRAAAGPLPIASRAWFKRSQRILGRDWPTAYLFVGLTVILLGTIKAYPFLRALWYSFHNVIGFRVGAFVGLDNYIALWGDDRFTRSIGVTLTFTATSVLLKVMLGLTAAVLVHNLPRWGAIFGGLLLVPYVIPDVVRALAWRMILDPLF